MRGGLFWKILLGFWLTMFGIIVGLWLVFVAEHGPTLFVANERPSPEAWLAHRVAPPVLAALAEAAARDGIAGFERGRAALPAANRRLVTIAPLAEGERVPPPDDMRANDFADRLDERDLIRAVRLPDGRRYVLHYLVPPPMRRNNGWPVYAVAALAGLVFSTALAWYLTRPIDILRDGFEKLAAGGLKVRVRHRMGRRRDELASLARAFDVMAERLEQLVSARDRLLHDVSHELRSPLTRMQLAIGLVRQDPRRFDQSLDRIEQEMARLDGLVRELLALSRAESGIGGEEYFDPVAVLELVLADARFEGQATDVTLAAALPDLDEEDRPTVRGNAELLRRAFENVIRNALRFAPAGSAIRVSANYDAVTGAYRFAIEDEGPGVRPADLATLFDPFVKVDQAGFGLGLAIARRAIVAHGGTIDAENLAKGFRVVFGLPVSSL